MLKIRLARGGTKGNPFYTIVAIKSTRKRGGKPAETLGFWHPAKDVKKIDKEKLAAWVAKGAIVSPAVKKLAN